MNRRSLLSAAVAGAATLGLGPRLTGLLSAFAEPVCEPKTAGVVRVADGLRRAAAAGKPLLVLVVPDDTDARHRYTRGQGFGRLFFHGPDEAMARFARVEIVAARLKEVAAVVPSLAVKGTDALMVLVETGVLPVIARSVPAPAKVEPVRQKDLPQNASQDEWRAIHKAAAAAEVAAVDADIAAWSKALAKLVDPGGRAAKAPVSPALIAEGRKKVTKSDVPGAWRGVSGGCGSHLLSPPPEVEPQPMMACGMGHAGPKSSHFLDFYVLERIAEDKRFLNQLRTTKAP